MTYNPKVSIVIPVKNEGEILTRCLESLANLDYPRESIEIVVADGMSTDSTKEVALSHGAVVTDNPRQLVGTGRNAGFKKATGEIVAFTDADCIFDPAWIKNSLKYFSDNEIGGVGGITLLPESSTEFEKAVNFIFSLANTFRTTAHRQCAEKRCEVHDIPGCNSIYRRKALEKAMPVDENLLTAEDVWLNHCMREKGYKLLTAPDVKLWHNRRSSPTKFARQIYRFAIGRVQVGRRNAKLLNIFHFVIGLSLPILCVAYLFFRVRGVSGLLFAAILGAFVGLGLFALTRTRKIVSCIFVPFAALIFLTAWSAGFTKEFLFPLKDAAGK
jgi:glycosyltransferase involved in cell wall biosynthesis